MHKLTKRPKNSKVKNLSKMLLLELKFYRERMSIVSYCMRIRNIIKRMRKCTHRLRF